MYNNEYQVNVTATSNASADDIANRVMTKISEINSRSIRGARG